MILADSSAWIEYDRASGSAADRRIAALIDEEGPLAVTEPVVAELLAAAPDDRRELALRRLLGRFALLRFDAVSDFDGAARAYRRCQAEGVAPLGMLDCMIATVAWRTGASLLTHDGVLARVARILEIPLDEASLQLA